MTFMRNLYRPGLIAPAVFVGLTLAAAPAVAQVRVQPTPGQPAQAQPLVSPIPVPSELELSRLIWSTIAAVDHANIAGNYSVLRDLSAPGFQAANDAAQLTQIFAGVRQSRIDLSNALLLAPTYTATPAMVQPGVLRVQGLFGLRPTSILFDLYYQWIGGRWRLFGVSIGTQAIAQQMPGGAPAPAPAQPRRPGGR